MTGTPRRFGRTIGIDYSGAETAEASLKGLRVYEALGDEEAREVPPTPGPRKYWTRRGIAEWLVQQLDGRVPTIVGIDHAFSFPMRYFERHRVAPDWETFLADFCAHWPTDQPHTYVDFVRDGSVGNGADRMGDNPKSCCSSPLQRMPPPKCPNGSKRAVACRSPRGHFTRWPTRSSGWSKAKSLRSRPRRRTTRPRLAGKGGMQ